MRELSDELLAAQESAVLEPQIRITFSDPLEVEEPVIIEHDRILGIPSQEESSDSQTIEIICYNSDGFFTDLDLQGWDAVFEWGLVTESEESPEYSAIPPMKVMSQYIPASPGNLKCYLSLVGIPNLMAEDKASKDYFHHWSDEKTVKEMITEIADGEPVETELTEEQTDYDAEEGVGYIDLDGTILHGNGQSLIISDRTVTHLAFRLKKTGSPDGTNVTFRIYDLQEEEELASQTFPIASIPSSPAVDFCEVELGSPLYIPSFTPTKETPHNIWIYCQHTLGDAENYVSMTYSPVAVKPNENIVRIYAEGEPGPSWETTDEDCFYRYKYTGAGIDCWERGTDPETYCKSYEVVYDDEEEEWFAESLLNTYMPKDAFRIYEGSSRWSEIKKLLNYVDGEILAKADGKLHIFVPKSAEPYDSEYSLESGHTFFSKAIRKALVIPSRIVVKSLKEDENQYSGEATDTESFARSRITGAPIRTKLISDAQATSIAKAMISRLQMAAQRGAASVPMNLGSEVFDYVKVNALCAEDTYRVGNIGYLRRSYKPGTTWKMDFGFGRVSLKGVPGTRPSLLTMPPIEPKPEETILTIGGITPTLKKIDRHFDYIFGTGEYENELTGFKWMEAAIAELWGEKGLGGLIVAINEIYSGLGWLEGQEPTEEQIDTALLPYYNKSQVNDKLAYSFEEPSRSVDTVYPNNTGKALLVNICLACDPGDTGNCYTDSSNPPTTRVARCSNDSDNVDEIEFTLTFIVKPDEYYKCTVGGSPSLVEWIEWELPTA